MRRQTFMIATASLSLMVTAAMAQPRADESRRRALIEEGIAESRAGNHAHALDLGNQAARIRVSPSLRFFLGEQHEFLSREPGRERHLFEAYNEAHTCLREVAEQPALNNRERTLADCTALRVRVDARVSLVQVIVPPQSDDTRVRVNGRELTRAEWGALIPVFAGEVVVEAASARRGVFRETHQSPGGTSRSVRVAWSDTAPTIAASVAHPRTDALHGAGPSGSDHGASGVRVGAWIAVGLGAIAGVVGVVQWARTSAQSSDATSGAGDSGTAWARYARSLAPSERGSVDAVCFAAQRDAASNGDAATATGLCDANQSAITMAYAFGLGGVALSAIGATLLLVSRRPSRATRVEVSPILGVGLGGATLRVRF